MLMLFYELQVLRRLRQPKDKKDKKDGTRPFARLAAKLTHSNPLAVAEEIVQRVRRRKTAARATRRWLHRKRHRSHQDPRRGRSCSAKPSTCGRRAFPFVLHLCQASSLSDTDVIPPSSHRTAASKEVRVACQAQQDPSSHLVSCMSASEVAALRSMRSKGPVL